MAPKSPWTVLVHRQERHPFLCPGVMSIFLPTCNFHCSSLFVCWSKQFFPDDILTASQALYSAPTLQPWTTMEIWNERENRIPTWWHRKIMMKVNDEPSFDVLFRNLASLPGGCSPEDPRGVTRGNAVMGRWKRITCFFLMHLSVYLLRGQERKRKTLSPAWFVIITRLQTITPCW